MSNILKKDGTWAEGKASPKLLREDLRELPGDYVATDTDDPDRIHELDAPHIVEAIAHDRHREEQDESEGAALEKVPFPGPGESAPLNQWLIDIVRFRIFSTLVESLFNQYASGGDPDVDPRHVWFPENNVNHYHLRPGPPPPDVERPKHLRNWKLAVDPFAPPESVAAYLQARGAKIPTFRKKFDQVKIEHAAKLAGVDHFEFQ